MIDIDRKQITNGGLFFYIQIEIRVGRHVYYRKGSE